MSNRKELIAAIASGDVRALRGLSNEPRIIVIREHNGKHTIADQEITPNEIEELKKDHCVVIDHFTLNTQKPKP